MPLIPATSLWADVCPNDRRWRQYIGQVALATVPFIVIAIIALIFDWMTHFPVEIGVTTYEVGGGILGIFLVLRTNSGYERWWEARKLWGGINNQCRSLATAAIAYGADAEWKTEFIRWTVLCSHAARRRLREEQELPEARRIVGDEGSLELQGASHLPVAIALKLARLLQQAEAHKQIPAAILMQMERDRISLIDYLGGCERILSTPVPRAYTIVIRQFLVIFLAAFPFGILQKVTWLTPLITAFVAFPMLALDEIGAELQNPFSTQNVNHLPLDDYCSRIENLLFELARSNNSTTSFVNPGLDP